MDKTIVISLLIFFLLLYIEWNNINSSNISFMFDHRFYSTPQVFSHFLFFCSNQIVENKKMHHSRFDYCVTTMKENCKDEKRKAEKRVNEQKVMTLFGLGEVLVGEHVIGQFS